MFRDLVGRHGQLSVLFFNVYEDLSSEAQLDSYSIPLVCRSSSVLVLINEVRCIDSLRAVAPIVAIDCIEPQVSMVVPDDLASSEGYRAVRIGTACAS
jgi:hypothetical protein